MTQSMILIAKQDSNAGTEPMTITTLGSSA